MAVTSHDNPQLGLLDNDPKGDLYAGGAGREIEPRTPRRGRIFVIAAVAIVGAVAVGYSVGVKNSKGLEVGAAVNGDAPVGFSKGKGKKAKFESCSISTEADVVFPVAVGQPWAAGPIEYCLKDGSGVKADCTNQPGQVEDAVCYTLDCGKGKGEGKKKGYGRGYGSRFSSKKEKGKGKNKSKSGNRLGPAEPCLGHDECDSSAGLACVADTCQFDHRSETEVRGFNDALSNENACGHYEPSSGRNFPSSSGYYTPHDATCDWGGNSKSDSNSYLQEAAEVYTVTEYATGIGSGGPSRSTTTPITGYQFVPNGAALRSLTVLYWTSYSDPAGVEFGQDAHTLDTYAGVGSKSVSIETTGGDELCVLEVDPDTFEFALRPGAYSFPDRIKITVEGPNSGNGGSGAQTLELDTSCNAPINTGQWYGNFYIAQWITNDGTVAQASQPCFPARATVKMEGGGVKRMDELVLGDKVSCVTEDGMYGFCQVFSWRRITSSSGTYTNIHIEGQATPLRLTKRHVLFVAAPEVLVDTSSPILFAGSYASANCVSAGDTIAVVDAAGNFVAKKVTDVTVSTEQGAYSPLVKSGRFGGRIVVEDVVATSFTNTVNRVPESYIQGLYFQDAARWANPIDPALVGTPVNELPSLLNWPTEATEGRRGPSFPDGRSPFQLELLKLRRAGPDGAGVTLESMQTFKEAVEQLVDAADGSLTDEAVLALQAASQATIFADNPTQTPRDLNTDQCGF